MAVVDFIYRDDLEIRNGDILFEESEQDHIRDIVHANKGEYRQNPLVGVSILNVLNGSESIDLIRKRIAVQLEFDNFDVESIDLIEQDEFRIVATQKEDA